MAKHAIDPVLLRELEQRELQSEGEATAVMEPPPKRPEVVRAPVAASGHSPLSERDQRIVSCVGPLKLLGTDRNAFDQVAQTVRERESAIRNGEAGQRVNTIRARIESTSQQLAEAKAATEQAEADHFTALGRVGDGSEAGIENARATVLAHQGRATLIESELESLQKILLTAQGELGCAVTEERPRLQSDIVRTALAKREAALKKINEVFDGSGLWESFKAVAEAEEMLQIVGSDVHGFTVACTNLGISGMFGRPKPAGHVSLTGPEIDQLDQRLRDGLRVKI